MAMQQDDSDELPGCMQKWGSLVQFGTITSVAKYMPLIAAIVAPTSTLLDIPALCQPWYMFEGVNVPDPVGCILLSAFGLALNVTANLLLVMRFSGTRKVWKKGTSLSLFFWMGKTAVALVNVSFYGNRHRNEPGFSYSEGFWSAVVSVIMAGVISIALTLHYLFAFGRLQADDSEDLRLTGRKFMFSVTFFMFLLGIQALAFNRIEHWSYLDSIYFSLQCALTVGYGDLVATTAAGKVLVFVFSVLTISQLANEVSIIIEFVRNRSEERRDQWRKKYSVAMHTQAIKRHPYATLIDEMSLIHQINLHQETMVQMYDLIWSGLSLATFWLLGAVIFHYVEGWGYGNAVYAVMVLSLTIGFGDFAPKTAAGRVIWIVYALMAVPIVTNFAVQTVGGIMYTWTEHRFTRARFEMERERDPEVFAPHSHFILQHHEEWDEVRDKYIDLRDKAMEEFTHSRSKIVPSKRFDRGTSGSNGASDDNANTNEMVDSPAPMSAVEGPNAGMNGKGNGSGNGPKSQRSRLAFWRKSSTPESRSSLSRSLSPVPQRQTSGSSGPTPAEEKVIGEMLDDPHSHKDVVEVLGLPDVISAPEDGSASGSSTTTRGDSPDRSKLEDEGYVVPQTATPPRPPFQSRGSRTQQLQVTPESTPPLATRQRSRLSRSVTPMSVTINNTAATECTPAMGPRLMQHGQHGGEEHHVHLTGDAIVDSHRLELHLVKELVDRVTRLEAQSRQMLIDCMDKDVARTLLLADRNLQIRDAFQLFGNDIDVGRAYKEEAEQTRRDAEERNAARQREQELLHHQAAIIDDYAEDEGDMLSRVRRYRSTFAEVLVLSSTLLKLEGEDLKRFERWHVGELDHYGHEVSPGSYGRGDGRRRGARGQLRRAIDFVSAKPEPKPRSTSPKRYRRRIMKRLASMATLGGNAGSFAEGAGEAERGEGGEGGGGADVARSVHGDLEDGRDAAYHAQEAAREAQAKQAAEAAAHEHHPVHDRLNVHARHARHAHAHDSPSPSPSPSLPHAPHALRPHLKISTAAESAPVLSSQLTDSPLALQSPATQPGKQTHSRVKEKYFQHRANRLLADTEEEAHHVAGRLSLAFAGGLGHNTQAELDMAREEMARLAETASPRSGPGSPTSPKSPKSPKSPTTGKREGGTGAQEGEKRGEDGKGGETDGARDCSQVLQAAHVAARQQGAMRRERHDEQVRRVRERMDDLHQREKEHAHEVEARAEKRERDREEKQDERMLREEEQGGKEDEGEKGTKGRARRMQREWSREEE